MKIPPSKKEASCNHGMMPDNVFANWMTAVTLLLQNYKQLSNLLASYHLELHVSANHSVAGVGQCPLRELQQLVDLFESELEVLLLDLNRARNQRPPTLSESYKKITDHTRRLHQLNRQAQIRLQVADQSAS